MVTPPGDEPSHRALARFRRAQDAAGAFARALGELRTGRKRGHWIWFVLPQLRGLGSSPMAERFGLDGVGEATAYLEDDVLRGRLEEVVAAIHEQSVGRGIALERLMGSAIDAVKCVSSLTLFEEVAGNADESRLARDAAEILDAAAAQGYPRCAFTRSRLTSYGARGG